MTNYCQKNLSQLKDNAVEKRSSFPSISVEHLGIAVVKYFENFTGSSSDGYSSKEKSLSQVFTCDF